MDIVRLLSWASVATNILLYSTGIPRCVEFYEKKSTGDVSSFISVATVANCVFWLSYGLLQNDALIWEINIVGLSVHIIVLSFFIFYTEKKRPVLQQLGYCITGSALVLGYIFYVSQHRPQLAATWLGFLCNVLTIVMLASPLVSLPRVIATRSTASMSSFLCIVTLICSVAWTAYGYAVDDIFLIVPNGVGCFIGAILCFLLCLYPRRSLSEMTLRPYQT